MRIDLSFGKVEVTIAHEDEGMSVEVFISKFNSEDGENHRVTIPLKTKGDARTLTGAISFINETEE